MTQVFGQAFYQNWSHLDLPNDGVAAPAEQSANTPGGVAVVNYQPARHRSTEQAFAPLRFVHGGHVLWRQLVLAHQPGAQVLHAGQLRVPLAPSPEPFIAPFFVLLGVVPTAFIRARLAVGAEVVAGFRERGER